jgi:hypothetical protein
MDNAEIIRKGDVDGSTSRFGGPVSSQRPKCCHRLARLEVYVMLVFLYTTLSRFVLSHCQRRLPRLKTYSTWVSRCGNDLASTVRPH